MGILDITDGAHPLLRRPFLDEEAPEEKSDNSAQSGESVERDDSTDDQTEAQADGQPCQDQATRLGDTDRGESDTASTEHITAGPSVHMDHNSAPTANSAGEKASG